MKFDIIFQIKLQIVRFQFESNYEFFEPDLNAEHPNIIASVTIIT